MESKAKTYFYVLKLTFVTAAILAGLYNLLEPMHKKNKKNAKRKSILKCIPDLKIESDVEAQFNASIKILAIDKDGNSYESAEALNNWRAGEHKYEDFADMDLSIEEKKIKDETKKVAPLYVYTAANDKKTYIAAVRGNGLWDKIWGYVAFDENMVVQGVTFDHKAETPGLGAEIKDSKDFKTAFNKKEIFKGDNVMLSIKKKGLDQKYDIKTISGATVTSDGVDKMIKKWFEFYVPYFKNLSNEGKLAYKFE